MGKKRNNQVRKVRKLKDGGVAFGNTAKIGRTGLILIPTFLGILIFIAIGTMGYYDDFLNDVFGNDAFQVQFEYVPFEQCEAIDFNSDECGIYKFCHEYEDGGSICHYHERGEHDQVEKMTGNKFSPEEQDFAPPGFFTPLVQWADARSPEEPSCYSTLCKQQAAKRAKEQPPEKDPEPVEITDPTHPPNTSISSPKKQIPNNFITFGIYKSKSCTLDVASGGDCITNRQLVEMFDNTNQAISGNFVEDEQLQDIRRTTPRLIDHWNYYRHSGLYYLFAVDPDYDWFHKKIDVQIIIEPSNFVFYDKDLNVSLSRHDPNEHQGELILNHNAYIKGCTYAMVKSDPQLIIDVINHIKNGCGDVIGSEWSPEDQQEVVKLRALPLDPNQHKWYDYNAWMNKKITECRVKC